MALRRHTRSVDGTIPIPALLYDDEELLSTQENVGIYDGTQKAPEYQAGAVHVTTHRLFYVDSVHPYKRSFALDLARVARTDHYAGLFASSPKVTLHLTPSTSDNSDAPTASEEIQATFASWECEVCAYRNPPGLSPAAASICALCGVPRSSVPIPVSAPAPVPIPASSRSSAFTSMTSLSSSLPSPSPLAGSSSSPIRPASSVRTPPSALACPACTFINHPSLRECELCATPLPHEARGPPVQMKSAPASRPRSLLGADTDEDDGPDTGMIKVSFRRGGDKPFYAALKRTLQAKGWQARAVGNLPRMSKSTTDASGTGTPSAGPRLGINGVLRDVETNAQSAESDMSSAFSDLAAFMVQAKAMVRHAEDLAARLAVASAAASSADPTGAGQGQAEPEDAAFIRTSLAQLGLGMAGAPVTRDAAEDERRWIDALARELAGVLQGAGAGHAVEARRWKRAADADAESRDEGEGEGGMMRTRGIVALDEVWGSWNRARGVALLPPSTLLLVLHHLPAYTAPPIRSRTLRSGLIVVHTPAYTPAAFAARLVGHLSLAGPRTTVAVAREERLAVALAAEMVDDVERAGEICRDDGDAAIVGGGGSALGVGEVHWWPNLWKEYSWDGQP